jgi:hypothetical protein
LLVRKAQKYCNNWKDPLQHLVFAIENATAEDARQVIGKLIESRGLNSFAVGGLLTKAFHEDWYKNYGFSSFDEYVQSELGISKSTAYYHRALYEHVVDAELSWTKLQHIGWTKIRSVLKYINKDNVDEWIVVAETMTAAELADYGKKLALEKAQQVETENSVDIQHGKTSTQVEVEADSDAYLVSKPDKSSDLDTVPLVSKEAAEQTTHKKIFSLYPDQSEVVEQAIKYAMETKNVDFQNVALTNICMHFMASYVHDPEDFQDSYNS